MVQCITKQIETIVKTLGEEGTLRVCSVGCGDGKLDKKIMRELATAHSALTIKYVGVGLCEQVEGEMEGVGDNVLVQVVAKDYSELSKECLTVC